MLDGLKGSFALSSCNDDLVHDQSPLEWAWSSNMRHTVFVTEKRVVVKRWDSPDYTPQKPLPSSPAGAFEILSEIETSRKNRLPDVISRMLKAFRAVRANIEPYSTNPADAIRVFNAFLLRAEQARLGKIDIDEWRRSRTVAEALSTSNDALFNSLPLNVENILIGHLLDFFVNPDSATSYVLEPDLLIRHASGQLYQEAHFEIEREAIRQPPLPGMGGGEHSKGVSKRDARFTPPSLARTIVQQAFESSSLLSNVPSTLRILDPACGSGIFLQEALRELVSRPYTGKVILQGFDTSEVSCVITKFCLERAAHDAKGSGMEIEVKVEQRDALSKDWDKCDFIFMNPPFMNLQRMNPQERDTVGKILGSLAFGHTDLSMAFLWRSAQSLNPGGVLGSILPGPMLNSDSAAKLREAILKEMSLTLVGNFRGYNYFPGAMVEPAFVILKDGGYQSDQTVKIVTAQEGYEDRSLRLLRQGEEEFSAGSGVEILYERMRDLDKNKWLPKTRAQVELIRKLSDANLPQVRNLFDVHQGIRAGQKDVFVLSQQAFDLLPPKERKYFRPLAGSKTIDGGQIVLGQYIFFPYDKEGLLLTTEQEVASAVPRYYQNYLFSAKDKLIGRAGIDSAQWWGLTRERSWQREPSPKLVSKAFGESGGFAYDSEGRFVVGQGYAWLWKTVDTDVEDEALTPDFSETNLPWAYVALLNSAIFRQLLLASCPQVSGGQFDLANKYVETIYLPDLSDSNQIAGAVVSRLAALGNLIAKGEMVSSQTLSEFAARAYGIPLAEWMIE